MAQSSCNLAGCYMTTSVFSSHVSLSSDDLKLLQEVWQEWCQDKNIDGSSDEAQSKARSLIDWFQFGVNDKSQLRSMLDPL
jgi:hypothetical protein